MSGLKAQTGLAMLQRSPLSLYPETNEVLAIGKGGGIDGHCYWDLRSMTKQQGHSKRK